jgi:hypothetical protein
MVAILAEKDLIPLNKRTKEEQKRIASAGGKASVRSRRAKKTMREAARLVLGLKSPEKIKAELEKLGIKNKDAINQTAMLVAILNKALRGDVRAAEFMRDTAGENPQAAQPQSESEDDPLTKSIYETVGDNPDDVCAAEKNPPIPGK